MRAPPAHLFFDNGYIKAMRMGNVLSPPHRLYHIHIHCSNRINDQRKNGKDSSKLAVETMTTTQMTTNSICKHLLFEWENQFILLFSFEIRRHKCGLCVWMQVRINCWQWHAHSAERIQREFTIHLHMTKKATCTRCSTFLLPVNNVRHLAITLCCGCRLDWRWAHIQSTKKCIRTKLNTYFFAFSCRASMCGFEYTIDTFCECSIEQVRNNIIEMKSKWRKMFFSSLER